jgi:secreted Zn-dependent insulinase-like peptidase
VLGLDHGNIANDAAAALAATLAERLSLSDFPRYQPRVTDVEGARRYQLDIDHGDAAMVLYLQDPDSTIASRARSALTASVLRQAYFTSLRTEQQLGYVVSLASQTVRDRGGLAFVVQSPAVSAAELERRTRDFLVAQQQALQSMPEDAFASYQQGLVAQLTERDRNLGERGARLWTDLDLGVTTFDSRTRLADAVAALDKAALLAYVTDTVARFDRDRLLVFSKGQFDDVPAGTGLDSVSAFKG